MNKHKCGKCGSRMIRANMYDPDGVISLQGGIKDGDDLWVCINPKCEVGGKNRVE